MPACHQCNIKIEGHHNCKFCSPFCAVHYRVERQDNGCLNFTGVLHRGYGSIRHKYKYIKAHRAIWEYYNGSISDGLIIRHKCDNSRCCNINHLEIGTHKDNSQDMKDRNRQARGSKNPGAILSEGQVKNIRQLLYMGHSLSSIGRYYKVSPTSIMNIRNRKTWNHI